MAKKESKQAGKSAKFLGELVSFRQSLKLIHWSITGPGSYETHISLDQAIDTLRDVTDRLVETTIAMEGTLDIVVPETTKPEKFIDHIEKFYTHIEENRKIFSESFSQSIIDEFQEGIKQLLYRLKRLS